MLPKLGGYKTKIQIHMSHFCFTISKISKRRRISKSVFNCPPSVALYREVASKYDGNFKSLLALKGYSMCHVYVLVIITKKVCLPSPSPLARMTIKKYLHNVAKRLWSGVERLELVAGCKGSRECSRSKVWNINLGIKSVSLPSLTLIMMKGYTHLTWLDFRPSWLVP